jgi:hypothetical protein
MLVKNYLIKTDRHKKTDAQIHIQTDRYTHAVTHKHTDRHTDRHANNQKFTKV